MSEALSTDRHPLLAHVHQAIADRSCSVLSLDIFDTVLWRRVPRPTDLFGIVGSRLRRDGRCPSWLTDASFRGMRISAERKARFASGPLGTEVSLFDIWREMPLSLFGDMLLEELVQVEVEAEREFTVVDLDIANLIQEARKQDLPVVLVSDTYFTEDQLAYLLDRPELGSPQDLRIFRSHQQGVDKASGLWSVVLKELGRSAEQLVHIGDNRLADHEVPAELGMRTVYYERIDERFAATLAREQEPIDLFEPFGLFVDPEQGDFGLTSLRAKTLQSGAPTTTAAVTTAWRYGASVLGPLLTGFAEWVAFNAHTSGTPVVWCPMREGELLAKLVNDVAQARGLNVEAKPLWLSRHVASIAALNSFDEQSIREFVRPRYELTVEQLLTILHLQPGDVPGLTEVLDTVLDNDRIVDRVSIALTETPHLRNRLVVTTTAQRERLLKHLRDCGALDSPELVLVDLGWGGTIQLQLSRVLRIAEAEVVPSGLYVATDERITRLHEIGLRAEGYLSQTGYPRDVVRTICRSTEVMEQCVNALCGSLIDFTEDGTPVLGPVAGSYSQNAERQAVQEGIIAFHRQWNRYVLGANGSWPNLVDSARARLSNIISSSLKVPSVDEASVFGNWEHDDNFGSSAIARVLPADLVPAIPYLSPNDLQDLNFRDSFWPGVIAASDLQLSAAAKALATGAVDQSMFEASGAPFDTLMRFLTFDGEWHDGPRRRVRINHNGLSFARMNLDAVNINEISLAIPGRPAIVRIDWLEAKVTAGGKRTPQIMRWSTPDDFERLYLADCTWLGGNLIQFQYPYSALWLPLAAKAGAPVSSVQITIAFAMLPQSRSSFEHQLPRPEKVPPTLQDRLREEYRTKGAIGVAAGVARIAKRQLGGRL